MGFVDLTVAFSVNLSLAKIAGRAGGIKGLKETFDILRFIIDRFRISLGVCDIFTL
jgi:hypothetical protein